MIIILILVTVKIMLRMFINKYTGADIYQKQNIIITSVIILRKVTMLMVKRQMLLGRMVL